MKAVLISIQRPHTTNIFDEIKNIEWRTRKIPVIKHYVYETKKGGGAGKIIGEYKIWRVRKYENVSLIPEGYIDAGCVPREFLEQYAKGKPLYAHFIFDVKRYKKPKELSEFCIWKKCNSCRTSGYESAACIYDEDCRVPAIITRPPQSWCYVEEVTE